MFFKSYVENPFVAENIFRSMKQQQEKLPTFEQARELLPQPIWANHHAAIDCYWKTWELAYGHLRPATMNKSFVANFIDTGFNDHLFMWDSAFIMFFGFYGWGSFDFQRTLDNFYARQHPDGFICRELNEADGSDVFERFDPAGGGPNIMPWTEWEYYLRFGDRQRLEKVFPVLVAFYQWFKAHRSWPDGSYWASGWACGMDNQPRLPEGNHLNYSHGHMSWIDTCMQQILSGRMLLKMADVLGRSSEIEDIRDESRRLHQYVNENMWDEESAFYYDRFRNGKVSDVKTVGAYWALPAEAVPDERMDAFIAHLENPDEFNRHHRVPTLSADHPKYEPAGGYWKGSVWPPTNYMVLQGLTATGKNELAHQIALNHHDNVVRVFEQTGTVWENYCPDSTAPGEHSSRDMVGWSGLGPITVLFEYVFGLRPNVSAGRLLWDVKLLDKHGVLKYPFGSEGLVDLKCSSRSSVTEKPQIEAVSNIDLQIEIQWEGGSEILDVRKNRKISNERQ